MKTKSSQGFDGMPYVVPKMQAIPRRGSPFDPAVTRAARSTSLISWRSFFAILAALTATSGWEGQSADSGSKPVLLYSRYYNAEGENRYLPDGTYKEVLQQLRGEFEVRVHNQPLTPETLAGVKLLLIANPSDKAVGNHPAPPHVSTGDIKTLAGFVEKGGGLIIMGNQENHNLEINDVNRLLSRFGIQFTNLYTDAKKLVLPREAPLVGGLSWAYYTGNLLLLDPSHPAKPRAPVMNDLNQKPAKGARDQPGCLLATAEPGKGRVVIATDSGWITDTALDGRGIGDVAIKDHDNWEMFRRLVRWAAGLQLN
ncbi:MAG TPA: hypothetical protein VJW76_09300 [Verrucomicrobiae bacterium]|nr:hypothetical protein [Verrucomicrobiae bacterium]